MKRLLLTLFILTTVITLTACNEPNAASNDADYDTTKKMVLDILQTDEGEKAVQNLLAQENMKKQLVIQDDSVKEAINKALVSDQGKKVWEKLFNDPTFVENYAKAMTKQHKKIMKDLMNDSGYQKQLLSILKSPEMNKEMLEVMKSNQFRSHLEDTIKETLQTPLFQAKMKETLLKAAEEQDKKEDSDKDKDEDKQTDDTNE